MLMSQSCCTREVRSDRAKTHCCQRHLIFKMTSKLYLGVRLNPVEKMTVIKINEIDLKEKVDKLRSEAAQQTNLSNDAFDLIYCGCLLENNSSLESYGLKSGSMVHVLKRDELKDLASSMSTSSSNAESNVEMLINIFKSFAVNPLLELAMRRLTKKPDFIKNIISSSPGLSEDTVAIAILQDPDLIIHFTNAETLHKIAKSHPALLEAAQNIASAVHDEAHNFAVSTANAAGSPAGGAQNLGNSYNLENFSDDEEMAADSSQSSDSTQPSNSNSRSQSIISPAQLFAAIQRARRPPTSSAGGNDAASSPAVANNSQSGAAGSGGVITFEMFNQAMQQAFATSAMNDIASSVPPPSAPPAAPLPVAPSSSDDVQRQISIMHEMGLRNDAVNLQALTITNGDVQAAIELVLSGFGEN